MLRLVLRTQPRSEEMGATPRPVGTGFESHPSVRDNVTGSESMKNLRKVLKGRLLNAFLTQNRVSNCKGWYGFVRAIFGTRRFTRIARIYANREYRLRGYLPEDGSEDRERESAVRDIPGYFYAERNCR